MNVHKHLLLCATPTKQKCFKGDEGSKTWECLKKTLKNYENDSSSRNIQIMRSKDDCLRILVPGAGRGYDSIALADNFQNHIEVYIST